MRPTTCIAPLLLAAGVAVGVAACASRVPPPPATTAPAADQAAAALSPQLAEGKRIFDDVCATCHSVAPPAKTAPPMSHVAMHYRERYGSDAVAIERIVAWVPSPAADKSALPEQARAHWGLMAPLLLPDERVRAVARYVMTLRDTTMKHDMGGMMQHQGGHGPPR